MLRRVWFLLAAVVAVAAAAHLEAAGHTKVSYEGYKVVRVLPATPDQLRRLDRLLGDKALKLSAWTEARKEGRHVDVCVPPEHFEEFIKLCKEGALDAETVVENVQKLIDAEAGQREASAIKAYKAGDDPSTFAFDQYHRHEEINAFIKTLAARNPSRASIFKVGYTYEGRLMMGIKIGTSASGGNLKPSILIDAGIHAREWIAPGTALFIINQLVNKYNSDSTIKNFVDSIDWYIVPSANPDGYEYSWNSDRLWRKTRSLQVCTLNACCYGVDPNRNFNYTWGVNGVSFDPCGETYPGKAPFTEPETIALSQLIQSLKTGSNLTAYLSLHSFGQLWLVPYGDQFNHFPPDYQELFDLASNGEKALQKVHNTFFLVQNSAGLYPASGASDDWSKGVVGVKYVYTLEVRDTGNYGFVLPPDQIIPSGEEVFEGIKVVGQKVAGM